METRWRTVHGSTTAKRISLNGPVIDPDVPSTGGVGTKAFTAAGIALMGVAAGAVIVTGKKKKEEQ